MRPDIPGTHAAQPGRSTLYRSARDGSYSVLAGSALLWRRRLSWRLFHLRSSLGRIELFAQGGHRQFELKVVVGLFRFPPEQRGDFQCFSPLCL